MTAPAGQQPKTETPNFWAAPLLTFVVLLVPTLILVFSNTESTPLKFAGLEWSAPLWVILLATFAVGIILGRFFGWLWGVFRRRRAKIRAELTGTGGNAG
jgi:uncharacterized integral membrane protein